MVDARIVQTTKALHTAIVDLASAAPVSSLTVADVTRAAGINRATFYSHASSPGGLLAQVLSPELESIRLADTQLREAGQLEHSTITRKSLERVVDHVATYREVYRHALPDPLDASTHRVLAHHFDEMARIHFDRRTAKGLPAGLSPIIATGYVSHGLVGAIEAWVTGKRSSRKAVVDSLVILLPTWWD